MKKLKTAVLDRFSVTALQRLKLASSLELIEDKDLTELEVAVVRTKVKFDKEAFNKFDKLKLIVTATSGFDHIDIHEAKVRGIQVAYCPEGNVHSASELTIMLALALARKTEKARAFIRKGEWDRNQLMGTELFGKTWGILGLGRIGRKVATVAQSLGMDIIACDPFVEDEVFEKMRIERMGLKELYAAADILSLHVPLTPKTKGIVNLRTMEHMSNHLLLVNTSRGEVVQEADLIDGLRRNMIAGFALDVFNEEPLNRKSALFNCENVVLTPHIGANTFEAFERSCHLAVDKVIQFSESQKFSGDPFEEAWIRESDSYTLD
jgi:D-3-phosphoglycerate dehydrogenase / 2-oxoglutarate reductase